MPAGLPYFAWVDPAETTFAPEHLRWDENIFSFTLNQDEGDPASLTLVVRRPRNDAGNAIGLLGPGRKIWCWFALDCGPDLIRFRGRLVGVPTSIFEELVTLEFVARPIDLVAQKEALAATLRVLPYYDEVVVDPTRRTDPEVVLEGYSAIWHYDRETHELTVSSEIDGEDGLIEFDGSDADSTVLYDGLGLTLTSGPLARVDVKAEYTWTQLADGNVDLTRYLVGHWPDSDRGTITSFSFTADSWPKNGATIGEGWLATQASCINLDDHQSQTRTTGNTMTVKFSDTSWFGPSQTTTTVSASSTTPNVGFGSISYPVSGSDNISVKTSPTDDQGGTYISSYSRSVSSSGVVVPLNYLVPTLLAGYSAKRQCTELVSFSLYADVQPVLTDPEDGEALRIDDIKSVNLSETIGEGAGAYMPIEDARRRSYIATVRGNRSIEYLIALAQAHLLKRARVVEIAFAPKLARMPEITLRKNAFLAEPRIGEALGKIINYSLALDGSDGRIKCEVRIGCAIGRGGSAATAPGTPTYCSVDYVGSDYQQFTGRTILFDASVGYEPPIANPNDDGLNFLHPLTAEEVIDQPLVVTEIPLGADSEFPNGDAKATATFKLKSMTREFSSDYEIAVTDLKIPTNYNLEAA
jgi:hypothetical protein